VLVEGEKELAVQAAWMEFASFQKLAETKKEKKYAASAIAALQALKRDYPDSEQAGKAELLIPRLQQDVSPEDVRAPFILGRRGDVERHHDMAGRVDHREILARRADRRGRRAAALALGFVGCGCRRRGIGLRRLRRGSGSIVCGRRSALVAAGQRQRRGEEERGQGNRLHHYIPQKVVWPG